MVPVRPPWTLRGDAHGLLAWMPGGRAGLMLFVRYTDSDVGPYDELLWLDPWGLSLGGARRHTITRIYVSTEASVFNGRINWGIPKELASFSVSSLGDQGQRVEVSSAIGHIAGFTHRSSGRALPVDLGLLPARFRTLVQVTGGQQFETRLWARGRLARARFSELAVNPALFPDVRRGRPLAGFSLRGFQMSFPAPRVSNP